MALTRKMTGMGSALAIAALLFAALAATASAQTPPFTAYGSGLEEGQEVVAQVDGTDCGSATVDGDGNWLIYVQAEGDCSPSDGDEISFTLDGAATNETETYSSGGAPTDVAEGIDLTLSDEEPTDPAPDPSDTGNAGLLGTTGGSMALVMLLGVLAATLVAGARTATRRS